MQEEPSSPGSVTTSSHMNRFNGDETQAQTENQFEWEKLSIQLLNRIKPAAMLYQTCKSMHTQMHNRVLLPGLCLPTQVKPQIKTPHTLPPKETGFMKASKH